MCSIISWNFLSLFLTSILCSSMSIKMSVLGTVGLLPLSPSDSSPSEVGSCVSAFRFGIYLELACPLCLLEFNRCMVQLDLLTLIADRASSIIFSLQFHCQISSLLSSVTRKKVAYSPYAGLSLKTAATKVVST